MIIVRHLSDLKLNIIGFVVSYDVMVLVHFVIRKKTPKYYLINIKGHFNLYEYTGIYPHNLYPNIYSCIMLYELYTKCSYLLHD